MCRCTIDDNLWKAGNQSALSGVALGMVHRMSWPTAPTLMKRRSAMHKLRRLRMQKLGVLMDEMKTSWRALAGTSRRESDGAEDIYRGQRGRYDSTRWRCMNERMATCDEPERSKPRRHQDARDNDKIIKILH